MNTAVIHVDVTHDDAKITVRHLSPSMDMPFSKALEDKALELSRHVADTTDAGVRRCLIEMGWTPPDHPIAKLARFGLAVHKEARMDGGCDIDGGRLQELAVNAGVLQERRVTEPCGDGCVCAYAGGLPGECFFNAADVQPLMD